MSTILIAYERESESAVLDELFTGRGHKVVRSANGLEALEAARRDPPELVISDILLPRMDGFALCRKWKQDERLQAIPFIFFTTRYDDPKYERFAEELKADRFLARPSEPDALVKAVDELLAEATQRGTGTARLPAINETNMRLSAQVAELQAQGRRQAETEAGFRRLFDGCPLPLWLVDREAARHVMVNDAALGLLGYSRTDFLALAPDALAETVPADTPGREGLVSLASRDGRRLTAFRASTPLEFSGRKAELVAALDLSQRVAGEQSLRVLVARQQAVFDAAADGCCVVDETGRLLDANPALSRLTGYSRDELTGLSLKDLEAGASGENTIRLHLERAAHGNRHETRYRRKDGTVVDVEVMIGESGQLPGHRVLTVRDVSRHRDEQVREQRHLKRLEAVMELQQAAESLDEAALLRRVLELAALVTGSPLALALTVLPERKAFALAARFSAAKGQAETLALEPKPFGRTGPWVAAIRDQHLVCENASPSGTPPEGVGPVARCIVVPLVDNEATQLLVAVANRETAYTEDDQREFTFLADALWRILRAKRSQSLMLNRLQHADVAMQSMIETLSRVADNHDPHSAGSAERVAMLAVAIGRELGLDGEKQHALRLAGLLHDVGNVMVPATLLARPAPLTDPERALVQTHAGEGSRLLREIEFGAPVADIVHQHHERYDGSGYPQGLKGEKILLEARILGVADVVEAMCSRRSWRPPQGLDAALDEIAANAGRLYDPHVAAACARLFRQHGFRLPGTD